MIMSSASKQAKLEVPASSTEMDQATAQKLFEDGGTLVFLEVPPGTEFGIDYNSWNVGTEFRGVKMIPPGVHFIFYSAVNSERQSAPRTGFFHNFKKREVLVKRWDKVLEDVSCEEVSAEEQERVESSKQELDRYLGPYPYQSYKKWVSLSTYMRPELTERLAPENKRITSVAELESKPSNTQSRKEAAEAKAAAMDDGSITVETDPDDPRLPMMREIMESKLRFTEIPRKKYPEGATASEMSMYSMDHSYVLHLLQTTHYQDNQLDILGEIQMAFTCFLLGQVYHGFEQWKRLVHLLCNCEEGIQKNQELYNQFITILHYQIREIPQDFFVDIITRNNFLVSALQHFFVNLKESQAEQSLKQKGLKFKENLEKKFKWDFSREDEEDEPVIVEENQ